MKRAATIADEGIPKIASETTPVREPRTEIESIR